MSSALSSFAAEWLKLRKRPAVWVLGAILVALASVFQYGVIALLVAVSSRNASLSSGVTLEDLRQSLYPRHWTQMTIATISTSSVGPPIAIILGVLAYGSEYGWATMKTVFTQRPGRLATLAGKLGALAVVLALYVVAVFASSAALSAALGAAYGALTPWPSALDIGKTVLSGWLILGLWAAYGILLSVLFRQSALAIGLGLIYAIVLEGLVLGLGAQFSWVKTALPWFPGWNASSLVRSFGSAVRASSSVAGTPIVGRTQAVLVVAAFMAAFVVVAAALLRRRDIS